MSEPQNPARQSVEEELRPAPSAPPSEPRRVRPAAPPQLLPGPASASGRPGTSQPRSAAPSPTVSKPTVMDRAMHGLRVALPLVQKVLPLLEGQVFTTLSNLLAPHPAALPPTDLSPLETSLADLKTRHMDLVGQLAQQNAALKRVTERLDQLQETSSRNEQEQKALREDLQVAGRKANRVAIAALCLLALSLAANIFLFLHFQSTAH
jgi:hypothetical protein